jgi:hypothetical protein
MSRHVRETSVHEARCFLTSETWFGHVSLSSRAKDASSANIRYSSSTGSMPLAMLCASGVVEGRRVT